MNEKLGGKTVQFKDHMMFVDELAVNAQGAGLAAEGAEAAGFVEAEGGSLADGDRQLDGIEARDRLRGFDRFSQQGAAQTLAARRRHHKHSPDVTFVFSL